MGDVTEPRIALTVADFDAEVGPALNTPWGDGNVLVRAPDGMELALSTGG